MKIILSRRGFASQYGESVKEWKPAFGQAGGAETQLKDICAGDIFLFYG